MPTGHQRSHKGCWTCKRRRRKCDETKPSCLACQKVGHVCEGYESRLKWDNGVASRGYLTGATLPRKQDAPPRIKGRQRDLLKSSTAVEQDSPCDTNLDPGLASAPTPSSQSQESSPSGTAGLERQHSTTTPGHTSSDEIQMGLADDIDDERTLHRNALFQEFLTSGSLLLHSTFVEDSPLRPQLSNLCAQSDTLFAVCVALQAYLSYGQNNIFYEYYSEALSLYRAHLHHPLRTTDEALLHAALLLCTIGIMNGTPWTVHIHGMQRLLDDRVAMSPLDGLEPNFINAIEVMGVFDLAHFFVGRRTPTLNIWQKYRAGQLVQHYEEEDSSQPVAGIPRSLLDLMALNEQLRETDIWLWPGCDGSLIQCQLWDAYRYALMLSLRNNLSRQNDNTSTILHQSSVRLPSYQTLLTKALSALDAIFLGKDRPEHSNSLVMNAINFPLFHVALHVLCTEDRDGRHALVSSWFHACLEEDPAVTTRNSWILIQGVTEKRRQGLDYTAEMHAAEYELEIGLF